MILKISPIISHKIYGKTSKMQLLITISIETIKGRGYDMFGKKKTSVEFDHIPLTFSTIYEVFKSKNSYLQTKNLRILLFIALLQRNHKLPRINYYAFPDK